jgi:hypothetical protein
VHNTRAEVRRAFKPFTESGVPFHSLVAHAEIIQSLLAFAEKTREDLDDTLQKRTGKGVRPPARFAAAK